MPSSADSSVNRRASSWMRWSGLTPISPAYARRTDRPVLEPLIKEIARQPFTRFELDHFAQPGLRDIEDEKTTGKQCEGQKLVAERRKVFLLNRIIKRLVPGIEADLRHGRSADHANGGDGQE